MRGWKPSGAFTLGGWGMAVTCGGALYLVLTRVNIVWPSSLASGRAVFNYGWVTLVVMTVIVGAGAIYQTIARPECQLARRSQVQPQSSDGAFLPGL